MKSNVGESVFEVLSKAHRPGERNRGAVHQTVNDELATYPIIQRLRSLPGLPATVAPARNRLSNDGSYFPSQSVWVNCFACIKVIDRALPSAYPMFIMLLWRKSKY